MKFLLFLLAICAGLPLAVVANEQRITYQTERKRVEMLTKKQAECNEIATISRNVERDVDAWEEKIAAIPKEDFFDLSSAENSGGPATSSGRIAGSFPVEVITSARSSLEGLKVSSPRLNALRQELRDVYAQAESITIAANADLWDIRTISRGSIPSDRTAIPVRPTRKGLYQAFSQRVKNLESHSLDLKRVSAAEEGLIAELEAFCASEAIGL